MAGFEGLALDDGLVFTNEYRHFSFYPLARAILRVGREHANRKNLSMLELGCGGGDLFCFLSRLGVKRYLGLDGNPLAARHSPCFRGRENHFRLVNLQQEIDFGQAFDLVLTFEVLEHIPEVQLDHMFRTIRNHMGPASVFLGTASLQEEYDVHVTVRDRAFWLAKFAEHGLVPHPHGASIEELLEHHHPFNWWAANTNIFALHLGDSAIVGAPVDDRLARHAP
jgi:SAM-dependent methyltransferase